MKNEEKTKEQLIDELLEERQRIDKLEALQTARNQMDKELKDREKQFRTLLESTNALPWELDLSTNRFTYVGPQVEKILGYPMHEWTGFDFWAEHIHHEDRDWAITFCQEATARIKDHEFEYRMLTADGRVVWLRDIVSVVADEEGPKKLRGFMFDITERKKIENELKEKIEEIEKFYQIAIDRELRMKELQEKMKRLKSELSQYKKITTR
jgi:PAS domain S-box-containing protein